MGKTRAEKKRKVSSDGVATVKAEESDDDAAAPVPAPPDLSDLSPIQKILRVDLLKDDSKTVESALTQLANMCLSSNEESEENRATVHRLGGAAILTGILRKWYSVSRHSSRRMPSSAECIVRQNAAFRKSCE